MAQPRVVKSEGSTTVAGNLLKMDLLKEWLGSTVARELNAALQWRERTPTQVRLSDNGQYEDDGSNLRAKSSKPGVVQIMKVGHSSW